MNSLTKAKHNIFFVLLMVSIALSIILVSCKRKPSEITMPTSLEGPYPVTRTVDGDTIVVNINGADTKIRLIGIDAPESVHPDKEKNTEEGTIASEYMKDLLKGKAVYLEYDSEYKDAYDRVLAYVYLEDKRMVNAILLEEGMAAVYTVPPNTKYSEYFLGLQKTAREKGKGFWEIE